MNRWLVAGLCVLASALASAGAPAGKAQTPVAELAAAIRRMHCPGALVGVFPDDGAAQLKTVGVSDVDTGTPLRLDARMRIGSVTKLFVGTAALRLVDRGVLSLDDPVSMYVSDVPRADEITLRMLGNQTSGLFDPIADAGFRQEILAEPRRRWRPTEVLSYAYHRPLRSKPGSDFRYANTGAIVLGQVIEAAAEKPLPAVVREMVLDPLELTETGFCTAERPPTPTPSAYRFGDKGRWLGYGDVFFDVTGYSASWSSWAGDMYSTLKDLGRATKPLATGHLLSDASRTELHTWTTSEADRNGYGFLICRDRLGIGHDGDVPGFNAVVRYSPARRASLVVLTNLSNNADGSMPAEELASLVWPADSTPSE